MSFVGIVNDILARKGRAVWSVPPDVSVFEAVKLMSTKNVGALLVMENDKLLGMISERDYARKIVLVGKASRQTPVHEIMIREVMTTTPQSTVADCMRIMTDKRVRHLPVLEGDLVVGIISIGDLVNWIISAQQVMINQLENYISGKYPS